MGRLVRVFGKCSLVLSIVFATSCGGGDLTPMDGCNQVQVSLCNKIFDCFSKDDLDAAKAQVGLNRADCAEKFQQTECTTTKVACDAGTKFNATKAQACLDGVKSFSCADIMTDPLPTPAACNAVCQ